MFHIRKMGLQLILNVEARKIEVFATQSHVPGPVVNLSLLATGPSLNKNQQAEKLSSLSVSLLFMVLEFHAAATYIASKNAARYRQSNHLLVIFQFHGGSIPTFQYCWLTSSQTRMFFSPNMSRISQKIHENRCKTRTKLELA